MEPVSKIISLIIENLKKRESLLIANRTVKASLQSKLDELGIDREKLIALMKGEKNGI